MKIGFEIHQQINSEKLFCSSPSSLREEKEDYVVLRRLRPSQSELGVVDEAAMKEFLKGKSFLYQGYNDSICLVELDEEPPRGPNEEAVEIALTVALLLNAQIVDEIHFMRKLVIDGSNTSGFQRTAIIAFDGYLDTDEGRINIPTICLEEEAARKVAEDELTTTYNLDRLGIPLVEITSAPDIKSPTQAREAALKVGELLRATGRVKRGIGTIRQDINVSIKGGARVEIKGVQDLNRVPKIIESEVVRQKGLVEIKNKLIKRGIGEKEINSKVYDISEIFKKTESTIIGKELKNGGVFSVKLSGFSGLLGGGLLGREIARSVRIHSGVKGIFHSDELPAYGITAEEVDTVVKTLAVDKNDAFVIVACEEALARKALGVVIDRAKLALKGPLEETRMTKDSVSEYMRPLPGAARMYPETDILPFVVSGELLANLKKNIPESYDERAERLVSETAIGMEQARQLTRKSKELWSGFEKLAPKLKNITATGAASIYLEWAKDVDSGKIGAENVRTFVLNVDEGVLSKEASSQVREELLKGSTIEEAIDLLGRERMDLESLVDRIIDEKTDFIKEKGMAAQKPLMGMHDCPETAHGNCDEGGKGKSGRWEGKPSP
jgi:glutamyl-tRNA(Gln) amidotransferase subunit E